MTLQDILRVKGSQVFCIGPEATLEDPAAMSQLRGELNRLRIGLAYDDFGDGHEHLVVEPGPVR